MNEDKSKQDDRSYAMKSGDNELLALHEAPLLMNDLPSGEINQKLKTNRQITGDWQALVASLESYCQFLELPKSFSVFLCLTFFFPFFLFVWFYLLF